MLTYKVDENSIGLIAESLDRGPDSAVASGTSADVDPFGIRQWLERSDEEALVYRGPVRGTQVVMLTPSDGPDHEARSSNGSAAAGSDSQPVENDLPVRPIRVLIVDDHIVMRQGLAALLELEADMQVIGEASDGHEAIDKARELRPDVIVMDITMPGMNGIEATRVISKELTECRIVALSMHETADMAAAMKEAGAAAYLAKGGPADELLAAIRNR